MVRKRALKIVVPLVALLFVAAFAKHRLIDGKIQQAGTLKSRDMDETSGIAASAVNPGLYYVHNDSGDSSRFFAISESGALKSTIRFKGDKKEPLGVRDCEDIAVGPGPVKKKSYVYLGDIGDNSANRKFITIYRFAENKQWQNAGKTEAAPAVINLRYPDGAWDAESLAIDPLGKLIYIITKRGDSVRVYTSPLVPPAGDTVTLTFRARLFFAGLKPFKWITAADISPDGKQVLVRSYEKVYYWQRRGNEPLWVTMQRAPEELPYKLERQGEAIGFTADGKGYLTTSEGVYAPIYYYKLPAQ